MKDFRTAAIPAGATVIPMWPMSGTIGIEQLVGATHQECGRLPAAAERGQIIAWRAEIDREPERINASEIRSLGRSRESDDGKPIEPVDAEAIQHRQHKNG